jgi:hypothetical protein
MTMQQALGYRARRIVARICVRCPADLESDDGTQCKECVAKQKQRWADRAAAKSNGASSASARVEQDNARRHIVRRPCANACGHDTGLHDLCYRCRRDEAKQRKVGEQPSRKGKSCLHCEGMSWRRPRSRPCKCGKRFAPELIEIDRGLRRNDEPTVKF